MVGNKRKDHYTGSQATLYFLFSPILREILKSVLNTEEKKECEAFTL